ncbi:hypothetical protein MC7420_806 [Coleofasciculus chthonoplastes PCC 7420]|uniref:Uncharacterized protein n=1 Tax=Coleofasciculus chthonoplastes PCC 7420 TaxID=118168 RepID=B4VT75_9CYAN|nr:hypothetical protein MC7420_806 [Coleofasciculus chthonoplastes PCC 7420]
MLQMMQKKEINFLVGLSVKDRKIMEKLRVYPEVQELFRKIGLWSNLIILETLSV